jgi:hypothetical protein
MEPTSVVAEGVPVDIAVAAGADAVVVVAAAAVDVAASVVVAAVVAASVVVASAVVVAVASVVVVAASVAAAASVVAFAAAGQRIVVGAAGELELGDPWNCGAWSCSHYYLGRAKEHLTW